MATDAPPVPPPAPPPDTSAEPPPPPTPQARDVDPLIGFQFSIEVGTIKGYFTEISGIVSDNEVVMHKVVNPQGYEVTLQIPGRANGGEFTLKRGMTKNLDFWAWREMVVSGDIVNARTDVTVTMYNRAYKAVRQWHMLNAWPSKLSGPQISSDSNDVTIEELTIQHEGLYADGFSVPTHEPAGNDPLSGGGAVPNTPGQQQQQPATAAA
jgi:phage tail-like protein